MSANETGERGTIERSLARATAAGALSRREAVGLLALAAVAAACDPGTGAGTDSTRAAAGRDRRGEPGFAGAEPQFFTAHEFATVKLLSDLVIPRDERSGSATEAGVPEFMDFMMMDRPAGQPGMRGGLAWLDRECHTRYGKTFVACADGERTAVLDDIAWPARARPELSHGVSFFNSFRDMVASGFWSSRMGVEDLQYLGNRPQASWDGCPEPALVKLGVRYPGAGTA